MIYPDANFYFWIADPDPTRVAVVIASPPAKTTKLCLKKIKKRIKIFSNKHVKKAIFVFKN